MVREALKLKFEGVWASILYNQERIKKGIPLISNIFEGPPNEAHSTVAWVYLALPEATSFGIIKTCFIMNESILNQAFTLPCGVEIPNRLVKAALSEGIAEKNGRPSSALNNLYEKWSRGGAGILLSGNVMVHKDHPVQAGVMVGENEEYLAEFSKLAEIAQAHGSQLWMQISHPGRQSPAYLNPAPVSASEVALPNSKLYHPPRALKESEIWDLIERFANCAQLAKKAGFKGVQIHGAHGYLVSQFLSPLVNQRKDQWGGSLENRARFAREIYRAMRAKLGADFPIAIKINSADFQKGAFSEEESLAVIQLLGEEGIDLVEVSGGTYEKAAMVGAAQKESTQKREAYFMDFIVKVRRHLKTPLMLTGGFRSVEAMQNAVDNGELDFIGLGRPFCLFPEIARELLSGERTHCDVPLIKTGEERIDQAGYLETPWHNFQLVRMGQGLAPDPHLDPWQVYEKITGKSRPQANT